ncbi:MAG: thiamine pyrophosphate-dependent enzyme, partial [Anaerolineae bacterium]
SVQEQIIAKRLIVYAINAYAIAQAVGLGNRINTIMQTCFFAISNTLPAEEAIGQIKQAIQDTYGKRGETVVRQNYAAVDSALAGLYRIEVPDAATGAAAVPPAVPLGSPDFVRDVIGRIVVGQGDTLPVSAMPPDGTFMSGTTQYQKRNMALEVPVWLPEVCIQCGRCSLYCPHAVVRAKVVDAKHLDGAPPSFKSMEARWREPELKGKRFTIQVSVEDCTGCAVCVEVCPAKDKTAVGRKALNMEPQAPIRERESANFAYFLGLPEEHPAGLRYSTTKNVQMLQPTFEFHSACAGCGETPYIRLLSQLFDDRLLIANATGCSSIYTANLPDTAWARREDGRGAAWINSLFEDNAEMGFGMRLAVDKQHEEARELVASLRDAIGGDAADAILTAAQLEPEAVEAQRRRVAALKETLARRGDAASQRLLALADALVRRSVWCIGGDGWAYDIGYGGLDHVLAMGCNVKMLVLDSQVYSNTGGQSSKSTALGAVAKFAAGGKRTPRKDLGLMAMSYGNVYVAQVAMGANDGQTIRAFLEAESYDGPALIIAYSTCIAQGINMTQGMDHEKAAVDSGHWILYRHDPRLRLEGKNPLQLDSREPKLPITEFMYSENRFRMLTKSDPATAATLAVMAQAAAKERWRHYQHLAEESFASPSDVAAGTPVAAPPQEV